MTQKPVFGANKMILGGFLFALSYFVVYALSLGSGWIGKTPFLGDLQVLTLPDYSSLMFYLLPAVGFFIIFFLVDWANEYFETKQALSPLFPVLFFVFSLAAFYVALFWYYANFAQLAGLKDVQFDYWAQLKQNAFLLFVWGGIFGWTARLALEKIKL
jgi:hypothetical protein